MTFRFEEENFNNLYVLEDYYCTNPFCDCNNVVLSFSDKENQENRITFLLNFNKTQSTLPDQKKFTPTQEQIVKNFIKELPDELMVLFKQRYHESKAYGENNPRSYLVFEPDQYVNYMLMFPKNKQTLDFASKGEKYYAEDTYKMDPRVGDKTAQLVFYKVDTKSEAIPSIFTYTWYFDEELREEEDKNLSDEENELLIELSRQIPELQNMLKSRLKEARKIGEELMNTSVAKGSITPHKPQRNELCSCGSGKKYKKCCALTVN